MEIPTPRTDAEAKNIGVEYDVLGECTFVSVAFARKLEREALAFRRMSKTFALAMRSDPTPGLATTMLEELATLQKLYPLQ